MKTDHKFHSLWKTGIALIITGTLIAAGCSLTPPKHMMDIQKGEVFILKQALTIPAEKARVYIQFGKAAAGFSHFEQHCRLEIKQLQDKMTVIQPDKFRISKVSIGEEQVASNRATPSIQLAFTGSALASNDNQRPETMDYVHLYLRSAKQPNVLRLTCAGALSNGDPFDAPNSYRPQRQQINRILGTIGQIQPKPSHNSLD